MDKKEKSAMVVFDLAYLAIAFVVSRSGHFPEIPEWLFFLFLGLAAYRGGRAVSYNRIFKWLRDAVGIVEVKDSSGAGDSVEASGSGVRRGLSELVACPVCSGTWVGMILIFVVSVDPDFGRVLVVSLGAAGIAELSLWIGEAFEWRGREAREVSGSFWIEKNRRVDNRTVSFSDNGRGEKISRRVH